MGTNKVAQGLYVCLFRSLQLWGLERKEDENIFKNSGGPDLETLLPALWTG
ncbi:TPA: hypothetical protein L9L57_005571 [Klebsiella pneumoniae]|nr:hypothetical protein [Klebsiella pneumoniae]HBR1478583.1 hypothetical protein [Klebsiella pneumoniae]